MSSRVYTARKAFDQSVQYHRVVSDNFRARCAKSGCQLRQTTPWGRGVGQVALYYHLLAKSLKDMVETICWQRKCYPEPERQLVA